MPKFKIRIAAADSNDLTQYDALCAVAKRAGFQAIGCGNLAELTQDQMADKEDSWVRFTAMASGITKFIETSLVNGIFSKAHIDRNSALIAEKSRILARHGLKGYFHALEPQWLPEHFYAKHPQVRGPRCDHPGVARSKYYAPCLDRPEVLAHYREAMRKLVELAGELGFFAIWTNDSGGGLCWSSGLYSGQNGPAYCKDIPFAMRMRKWIQAIQSGAQDAGKRIEVLLTPVHFSPDELYTTLSRLPKGSRFVEGSGANPNEPFVYPKSAKLIAASKAARRPALISLDPTLGYPLGPVVETPIPFFMVDVLGEAARSGAEGIITGGLGTERNGVDTISTLAVAAGLARAARSNVEVDREVLKIAKAQVGAKYAPALVAAWRDVDHAFRVWPLMNDPEHMMYTFYSIMGARWLVRPLVPAPELLSSEEKAYFSKHRHGGRDPRTENAFFIAESRDIYVLEEFKWVIEPYNVMLAYMGRALATLDAALAGVPDTLEANRLRDHYRRIAILAALWRTTRNVFACGSIIEHYKSARRSEFEKRAPTNRRLFLEGMDDEIANCHEMIKLLRESPDPLIATGEVESSFVLPKNLVTLLETKIALMELHKKDVDVLFPNCPPEVLKDETYEDTDKKLEAEGK